MTLIFDENGLDIDTFDESLENIILELQSELSLTDAQVNRLRTNVSSSLGQLARQHAERDQQHQEALLAVYNTLSWDTSGAALDRVVRLVGVTRLAATNSRVLVTVAGGTPAVDIPDGTRYQYNPTGNVFLVDGDQTLDGSGELVDMPLVAANNDAVAVALDPDADATDWTLLDVIVGAGAITSTEQPIVGHPIETDAALRSRAAQEAFLKGRGTLAAINAAVRDVPGVTYARATDNPTDTVNAAGLDAWSTNLVVDGGSDLAVAQAFWTARSAGSSIFAFDDATLVEQVIIDEYGFSQTVRFNRVAEIDIYIRVTATTSTAEEAAVSDLADVIAARIVERGAVVFSIGVDVVTFKIVSMLNDLAGIDALTVTMSTDDVVYSGAKIPITVSQRASFDVARIDVTID